MTGASVGLLGLYLALYDEVVPEARARHERFYASIAAALEARRLKVETAPLCSVKPEFADAVTGFEEAGAHAIVTLHLAYSPSLESAEILAGTDLPLIICDTTPTFDYGPQQDPDELLYNHGIHGVQDMCNLLVRSGKEFFLEAGHWEYSDVLDRTAQRAAGAAMAERLRQARVGIIGKPFPGMGDFYVAPSKLRSTIGSVVVNLDAETWNTHTRQVARSQIEDELELDAGRFDCSVVEEEVHRRSVAAGLAVRSWLETERLDAFTFNFRDLDRDSGFETIPFLEASKQMANGVGYAGEGDTLTALLVYALATVYQRVGFTEMFCPDWKGGRVFLSHMGETNWRLLAPPPTLLRKPYDYSDAEDPAYVAGRLAGGDAMIVNLAPLAEDRFRLITAPIAVEQVAGDERMQDQVRGWFKPPGDLAAFLTRYSYQGGTHHCAIVYGKDERPLQTLARIMGWDYVYFD